MNNYSFSINELDALIERVTSRVLEETGAISKYINRKEMVQRVGRGSYERGINEGYLKIIKKGGRTSPIYCLRREFENYEKKIVLNN